MSGKTAAAIATAIILSAGIPSSSVTNKDVSPTPPQYVRETSLPPDPKTASSYLINLENGLIYLTELDSSGTVLTRKTINYINIYSLYPSQLEQLRTGAVFDNREAAAEFIQDLGS